MSEPNDPPRSLRKDIAALRKEIAAVQKRQAEAKERTAARRETARKTVFATRVCLDCRKEHAGAGQCPRCGGDLVPRWEASWRFMDRPDLDATQHYAGQLIREDPGPPEEPSRRPQLPPRLRFLVLRRDGFRCQYCGRSQDDGARLQIDHIVPVAHGGRDDEENLITACTQCNQGKSDLDVVSSD